MRYLLITLKNLFLTIVFVYVVLGMFLYFAQDSFMLPGDNQFFEHCTTLPRSAEPVNYHGERFFYANNSDDSLVIFYHGNARSSCDFEELASRLESSGVSYILSVYPGYAKDNQNPTIKSTIDYTHTIDSFMEEQGYKANQTMILGYSIGGSPASYHSQMNNFSEVFIVSSFSRLSEIAGDMYGLYPISLMMKMDLRNDVWLEDHRGRISIAYTEDDMVVDRTHTESLISKLDDQGKEVSVLNIEGSSHGDIMSETEVLDMISDSIALLR